MCSQPSAIRGLIKHYIWVPFHESFSRLGIAQTLRDLPSALGLTKALDYIRPDINVFAFVAEKGFAITSGNLIEDLQESDENYDNNSFDSYF